MKHTHCQACGEPLAAELVQIEAPYHVLCGSEDHQRRMWYCLWGRTDGKLTAFTRRPREGRALQVETLF